MTYPLWVVHYTDGSSFSSFDGFWADAPARGVVGVVGPNRDVGVELMTGMDFYLWWPGAEGPWSVDKAGLWDFLYEVRSPLAGLPLGNEHFDQLVELGVKFGRSMDTRAFHERVRAILNDERLPPKTGLSVREVLK